VLTSEKIVWLSGHARVQAARRGTAAAEIEETIRPPTWTSADGGRFECRRDIPFGGDWNGKHYETRQVRPIFVEEATKIVVVTVYVYYF
jgi:hypothetical protein